MKDKREEINRILDEIEKELKFKGVRKGKNKNSKTDYFLNYPIAFDIETSSFYNIENEKTAIMYIWVLAIGDYIVMGRTWAEFIEAMEALSDRLQLGPHRRAIIYVHNLAYEFQFMRKYFAWSEVFALSERKPVSATTTGGIEFRCSYIESGYNLETIGKNLRKYKVEKMTGDLDYSKIRHSKTELTTKELGYCINDVRVLIAYIRERIEQYGNITKLSLTKTGYVRRFCRKACIGGNNYNYKRLIKGLTLSGAAEYRTLKNGFQGGYTHANSIHFNELLFNVVSYDFTSSYPAVMIAEQFPMSKGERLHNVSRETFNNSIKHYCCIFDIEFINIRPVKEYDHYISVSRCFDCSKDLKEDNGRVVSASMIKTTITEQDFEIIKRFYKCDSFRVSNFIRYRKGYLPTEFVECIISLYEAKTELKGVEGKEAEYQAAKENLNSLYGMCCTDIVRPEIMYNNITEWQTDTPITEAKIDDYNNDDARFLFYPWGVWITAYARRNLWTAINNLEDDYIYSDTDSVKVLNIEEHMSYFENYNKWITKRIRTACEYHGIDPERTAPKTIKGVRKPLGVWDFDGHYKKFKTLGAKRYIYEDMNGDFKITVAGLSKKFGKEFMLQQGDPFNIFVKGMKIPAEKTGKNTHTYIDEPRTGDITDYKGETCRYSELSAVHLEGAPFELTIGRKYEDYIIELLGGEVW